MYIEEHNSRKKDAQVQVIIENKTEVKNLTTDLNEQLRINKDLKT